MCHKSVLNTEDVCLADSPTTHTILQNKKYFSHPTKIEENIDIISETSNLI